MFSSQKNWCTYCLICHTHIISSHTDTLNALFTIISIQSCQHHTLYSIPYSISCFWPYVLWKKRTLFLSMPTPFIQDRNKVNCQFQYHVLKKWRRQQYWNMFYFSYAKPFIKHDSQYRNLHQTVNLAPDSVH